MPDPYIVFPGIATLVVGGLITWGVAVLYSRWQDKNARAAKDKRCNTPGTSADGWNRVCTLPRGHSGTHLDQRASNAVVSWRQ